MDMRDLSDQAPCDPYHPSHTSECCDRGYYQQPTKDEKRSRGQCRYWIQGRCYRGEGCRFAHIELCKYQDKCIRYEQCGYLHLSEKKPFLDSRIKKKFIFCEEGLPRLERRFVKRGKRKSKSKANIKSKFENSMFIMGANSAGLSNKKES